jgi:hypothetical protein
MKNCELRFLCLPPVSGAKDAFLFTLEGGKYLPMQLDEDFQPSNVLVIPDLNPQSLHEVVIYLRSSKPDKRSVIAVTDYDTLRDVRVANKSEIVINSELPLKSRYIVKYFLFHVNI